MRYEGRRYHSLWYGNDELKIIDQRFLPGEFRIIELRTCSDVIKAIKEMALRGAPLIGVAAAYGTFFAYRECLCSQEPEACYETLVSDLKKARPTAVNLIWAVEQIDRVIKAGLEFDRILSMVKNLEKNEILSCKKIGENGALLLKNIAMANKSGQINVLTHCNAGWLATVDIGTASAPVFKARDNELDVHVWIGETRPRNQGGKLTAWEYFHENIPHTVVSDNSVGHLMQKGLVDIVITGADRIAKNGDTANKIGTYLRALAAKHNNIPFYIAAPLSTVDFSIRNGDGIIIEERDENELRYIGETPLIHELSPVLNHAFDITPAELITGIITERGIFKPEDIKRLSL
ncbi:MAG: S-methyl-5-thioribose-1-phosphate isomerase [Candidatus Delongbacteria bacterium]|nr:S-methyl-5-thioribose-1-phosphate isomerase [Candidatus Delongbacteria bacterium]